MSSGGLKNESSKPPRNPAINAFIKSAGRREKAHVMPRDIVINTGSQTKMQQSAVPPSQVTTPYIDIEDVEEEKATQKEHRARLWRSLMMLYCGYTGSRQKVLGHC